MGELGRRAFGAILGSGAFVFFDRNYGSDGGSTGGNATAVDDVDIRFEGEVLSVTQDPNSTDVTVAVDVDAVNYGTVDGTQLVEFRDQVETLEERSVPVEAGASEPVQFSEIYQSITESDVTLDVTNATNPPQVALDLPRSDIQFSNATITDANGNVISQIEEGQTFYVSGDVENFGAIDGEKTYVLYGDSDELDSTTATLASGAASTIELSHTYNDLGLESGETSRPIDLSVNEQGVGEISVFAPAIPDSAIHQWQIDEGTGTDIGDSIGSNKGTLTNGTWQSKSDAVGDYQIEFSDSGVIDANSITAIGSTKAYTVAITLNPNSPGDSTIWSMGDGTERWLIHFTSSGGIAAGQYDGSTWTTRQGIAAADVPSSRFRLTVRQDNPNGNIDCFVDASNKTDSSVTTEYSDSTDIMKIAALSDGTKNYSGTVDNPIIYDKYLTDSEITDDYNAQPWA